MDIDLFQGILLGLLAVGLIVLIALLATLGGIRKALERASSSAPGATAADPAPIQAEPQTAEPEPVAAAAAVTPAAHETPEPSSEAPAAETTPSTEEETQAATIRAVLSQHGVTEASSPASASSAPTPEPASVVAAHIDSDEPEEEPFQRDGRWWFKRGEELLVYNEGTAQWEPADRPGHWSGGATSAAATEAPAAASTSTLQTATTAPQAAVGGTGTGWKCPSCGAINGSTAASCRMCFTARP